jgi:hypothetical protein
LAFPHVFGEKQADIAIEGSNLRRIEGIPIGIDPIKAPEPCLAIKNADGATFKGFSIDDSSDDIGVAIPFQYFIAFRFGFELDVFLAVGKPGFQVFVLHVPFADEKIEIMLGGRGRGGDDQVSFFVKVHRRDGKAVDDLGLTGHYKAEKQAG